MPIPRYANLWIMANISLKWPNAKRKTARIKTVNTTEVQLSPSIDTNDFNTKCNHAIRFLKSGDKVKVAVRFRGREISHAEIGEALLLRFAESVKEYGNMDKAPKLEGRNMIMFITPLAQ